MGSRSPDEPDPDAADVGVRDELAVNEVTCGLPVEHSRMRLLAMTDPALVNARFGLMARPGPVRRVELIDRRRSSPGEE